MSRVRRNVIRITLIVFLSGIILFAYPFVRGIVLDFRLSDGVNSFIDSVKEIPFQPDKENAQPDEEDIPHKELWEAANAYNRRIWEERQTDLSDPSSYMKPCLSLKDYGFEDEVFAVISIPAIELQMPIYLGASEENLAAGAAHLSQTSLPTGGNNTNCVIAGHRGWHNSRYFSKIVSLKKGDTVYIKNIWETLVYRVCDTKAIESYEVDRIKIQPDRDMVTLITCYYRN